MDITTLRLKWEEAHGKALGSVALGGAMSAFLSKEIMLKLYETAEEIVEKRKSEMAMICVFCMSEYPAETFVCPACNEYKGLMPINEAKEYLQDDE